MSILIIGPSGRIDRIVDENVLESNIMAVIKRELPQPIAEEIEEFNRPARPIAMATSIGPGMYSVASTIFGNAKTSGTYSVLSGKVL